MLVSVGAILVSRLPHHLIGWLLVIGGLVIAISGSTAGLADYGLTAHPGSVPDAIWLAWLSQWPWAPEIAILFMLLPLFYPTGRLPSARWRVVVIAATLVVIGSLGSWFAAAATVTGVAGAAQGIRPQWVDRRAGPAVSSCKRGPGTGCRAAFSRPDAPAPAQAYASGKIVVQSSRMLTTVQPSVGRLGQGLLR
jgi:hypothetical protein